MKRTFTSAPKTMGMGRRRAPNHYSFNDNRVSEIERENRALADRLARVESRPGSVQSSRSLGGRGLSSSNFRGEFEGPAPHLRAASVASSSINRKKANDKIAKENAALLNRLNNIRPSKDLGGGGGARRRPPSGTGGRPVSRGHNNGASSYGRPRRQPRPEWVD